MPYLETPALTMQYETAGTGRSVAILVHGNFATSRWWRLVLEHPPEGYTIYAPTLRGFGETRGARARSIHELAHDVRAFARGLGVRRFHLVGHSLGGAVALQYALGWPETLRSLGLVAPAPGDGLEAMRSRRDLFGQLLAWTDPTWPTSRMALATAMTWSRLFGGYRLSIAHALARMMPSADPDAVDFTGLVADAVAVTDGVLIDIYEALRHWDVRAQLPTLAVRARVLAGRRDALVSLASLEALARATNAQLDVWDNVGHSPQLEDPAAFAAWLARAPDTRLGRLRATWSRLVGTLRRALTAASSRRRRSAG